MCFSWNFCPFKSPFINFPSFILCSISHVSNFVFFSNFWITAFEFTQLIHHISLQWSVENHLPKIGKSKMTGLKGWNRIKVSLWKLGKFKKNEKKHSSSKTVAQSFFFQIFQKFLFLKILLEFIKIGEIWFFSEIGKKNFLSVKYDWFSGLDNEFQMNQMADQGIDGAGEPWLFENGKTTFVHALDLKLYFQRTTQAFRRIKISCSSFTMKKMEEWTKMWVFWKFWKIEKKQKK